MSRLGRHAPIQLPRRSVMLVREIRSRCSGRTHERNDQSFMAIMTIFLLLFALPSCFSCNAHTPPKNRAKIVEDYVVSAKFDENRNLPQLSEKNQLAEIYQGGRPEAKDAAFDLPSSLRRNHKDLGQPVDDFEDRNTLEERDLLVHHHHIPPLPHPPPPPVPPPLPPPVGLAYAPSLFAVGLITFLILLNSLQTSFLLLKSKGSGLGSVTGALGRRKRSAFEHVGNFRGKPRKLKLNLTRGGKFNFPHAE